MRKHRVEITGPAESDILEIFAYISRDNRTAATQWVEEIERQIGSLERFPERCPVIPESKELGEEYRHLVYGNYRTIFRIEESKIIIMRVIHGARLLDMGIFKK
ncbi:MAG: type II toxin-antitoxin system RelE/ParE family toxin [Pseudomonadota bacterium]